MTEAWRHEGMKRATCFGEREGRISAKRIFPLVLACLLPCVQAFSAVPTKAEMDKVRDVVESITEPSAKKVRAKEMKASEAAEEALSYVEEAKSAAAKYMLYGFAFEHFVKAGAYDEATGVYDSLSSAFGLEGALETAVPFRKKEMRAALAGRKPSEGLRALAARIDKDDASFKTVRKLKAAVDKNPGDKALTEQLGIAYAVLGSWSDALAALSKAEGKIAEVAAYERDYPKTGLSLLTTSDVADFWWDYTPKMKMDKGQAATFRRHAATWYARALENDSLSGLLRMRAEKRAEEAEVGDSGTGAVSSTSAGRKEGLVMVIPTCEQQPVEWRYTFSDPGNPNWRNPGTSLASWKKAAGPFGTTGRCKTGWTSQRLWAAHDFTLSAGDPQRVKYVLVRLLADDGMTMFVNGNSIGYLRQWNDRYGDRRLGPQNWASIFRPGVNRIAVELSNVGGDSGFDLGVCLSFDERPMSFSMAALPGTRKIVLFPAADQGPSGKCRWKYTTKQPASRWEQPSFLDARKWDEAPAPFGRGGYWTNPNSATDWPTSDIWLRKEVVLEDVRSYKSLVLHGRWDNSLEVWVNGVKALVKDDRSQYPYEDVVLSADVCRALKNGKNIIAAKCRDWGGDRVFDIGLYAVSPDK